MGTLVHRKQRRARIRAGLAKGTVLADEARAYVDLEGWSRPAEFPSESAPESSPIEVERTRWLAENDVHTEFLDAGIGCCWFARQGEQEPVAGETESEAIERLARANGLQLWEPTLMSA